MQQTELRSNIGVEAIVSYLAEKFLTGYKYIPRDSSVERRISGKTWTGAG